MAADAKPLVLIVGDAGAGALAAFIARNADAMRFARAANAEDARLRAAEAPLVVVAEHAPPRLDARAVLEAIGGDAPDRLAVVLTREAMARDARAQALGVRAILPLEAATAEDVHWAVADALECAQARRSLRASEARFDGFMDALAGGAWIKEADGRLAYVNRGVAQAFGRPAETLIGRTSADLLPPDLAAAADEIDRQALAGDQPLVMIEAVAMRHGPPRHMLITRFALPDGDGGKRLGAIAIDVTLGLWQFIDKASYGAAMFDCDLRLQAAGEKFWRALDVATPPAPGVKAGDIASAARIDWARIVRACLAGDSVEPSETAFAGRDGTRWLRWSAYPWTDHSGTVAGVVATVEDMTEAKRAERERRALEDSLRAFFENAAVGAAEISGEGRIVRVTRRLSEIVGHAAEDLLGRSPKMFVRREDRRAFLPFCRTLLREGGQAQMRGLRFARKDGVVRALRITAAAVRDAAGKMRSTTAIVEDITERIEAEAAQRASEARCRIFFEDGAFGAIEAALDGGIQRVNKALCDLGGWREADLVGHKTYEFVHPDSRDAYRAARAAFSDGRPEAVNRVWRIVRKDGSDAFVRLHISMMRGEDGAPIYSFGIVNDVTEQIKAEEALRASEARYRAFFNNSAFGAFEGDLEGRLTNVNQCFADLGGYAPEEMIGRLSIEFIHEADWARFFEIREAFLSGRMTTVVETRRFRRKDGGDVWVRFRPLLVRDDAGAPIYMCGIAEDISEARKAETALRESEERLRKLSDNLPDSAVYTLTRLPGGMPQLSYISAGVEKIAGVTPQEAIADTAGLMNLVAPDYHAAYLAAIGESERALSDVLLELPITRRDGKKIWIRLHSRPTRREDGVVWDGVLTDITDRKLAELALAHNEALLTAVLDGAQDAVLSVDQSGDIQSANAAAAAMFGYGRHEMIGQNIAILCAKCRSGEKREVAARDFLDSRPRVSEGARKDGSVFPLEIRRFHSQIDGRPLYVDYLRDLSERRLVEARMEQLKAQRLAAMGGMAGALAHELNQPLAAITLHVETAQRLARLAPEDRPFSLEETLDSVVVQALRAGEIIAHLRRFAARGEPDKSIQNLHALLREVCASAPGKGPGRAELRLEAAHDEVFIDKVQIKQVFLNLIRNAFEAMATAPDPVLTIATRNEGDKAILVDFSDRGHGVSDEMRQKLFEPLATTKAGGMGIGLSLSRAIASIHSGSLKISANGAHGATFTLMLPLRADP